MYLLCLTGLLGIAITGDAFNAFVFLEISSLSTYVLIALGPDRRALIAAFQYLIMGTIGATFYVIGVGLALSPHRHAQHGRHGRAACAGLAGAVANRRRGAGVRDGRRQSQARAVPAPCLAAERLCLRAVMGDRVSLGDRDQGRDLSAGPVLLLDLRRVDRYPRPADRRDHHRAFARRDVHRVARSRCSRPI